MRKMKFFSVSAALFAVGMLVTSCWTSDDPVSGGGSGSSESPKTAVVTDIDGAKYSVKVASNLPVTFEIDASATDEKAEDGKSATFSDIEASKVNVTVKYTGSDKGDYLFSSQTATVEFSKESPSASLNFVFVKKSTTYAQADVIGKAAIENTDKSVAKASLKVDEGTTVSKSGDFSITLYKLPANVVKTDDIKDGTDLNLEGGYVLNCQPDGATFSKPVTLKVHVGAFLAGKELKLENNGEIVKATVDGAGDVRFSVNHFSNWTIKFPLKAVGTPTTSSDLVPPIQTIPNASGETKFTYTKKVGFDTQYVQGNADDYKYFVDMLSSIFGDLSSSIEEEASFTVDGQGIANISVFQNKRKITLKYDDGTEAGFTFDLTRYEDAYYQISVSGTTHSGGSGK
jgi:ribosomal protein S8E